MSKATGGIFLGIALCDDCGTKFLAMRPVGLIIWSLWEISQPPTMLL